MKSEIELVRDQVFKRYLIHRRTAAAGVITKKLFCFPCLVSLDLLAICSAFLLAYALRNSLLTSLFPAYFQVRLLENTVENIWWFPLAVVFCLAYEGLYQKRLPAWTETQKIFKAVTLAVFFTIVLLYLSKVSEEISRPLVVLLWFFSLVSVPLFRYFGKLALVKMNIWSRPVIIIGAGRTGRLVARALLREKTMGYEAVGFVDDSSDLKEVVIDRKRPPVPLLGPVGDVEKLIRSAGVEDVIVAEPALPSEKLVELTNRVQALVNNVILVPDLFGLSMNGIEAEYFFEEQLLLLHIKNRLKSPVNIAIKRAFDLTAGTVFFLLCLPLLLLLALAIRIETPGPALYTQKRLGQNGVPFKLFKFRTMYMDADRLLQEHLSRNERARREWETHNKLISYDPRLTRVGRFMRKFSLDELPQLFNVVLGEMSLVGPRPYLPRERARMGAYLGEIQITRPGLTGLWQVSGRNLLSFESRLKLDVWYVKNWSLWLDIVILLKTPGVVLKSDGAY